MKDIPFFRPDQKTINTVPEWIISIDPVDLPFSPVLVLSQSLLLAVQLHHSKSKITFSVGFDFLQNLQRSCLFVWWTQLHSSFIFHSSFSFSPQATAARRCRSLQKCRSSLPFSSELMPLFHECLCHPTLIWLAISISLLSSCALNAAVVLDFFCCCCCSFVFTREFTIFETRDFWNQNNLKVKY